MSPVPFCLIGLWIALAASAASVAIPNSGFEDPALENPGDYDVVNAWISYDPFETGGVNVGSDFGVYRPPSAAYPNGIPDGLNVGWIYNLEGVEIGMQQALSAVVRARTRYTLSLLIGNPMDYDDFGLNGFPGYRIELVAGNGASEVILATDDNSLSPLEGTFEPLTIEYTSPEADPVIGRQLAIRLICFSGPGLEVDFDEVTLNEEFTGSEPPFITEIQRLETSGIQLIWDSQPNQTYTVLGSSIPSNFLPLMTDIPSQGGVTIFTFQDPADTGEVGLPARFFQVLQQAP